jgi:cytochrome P450
MTTTAESQSLLLQLLDPSNRSNPYPAYTQIREHGALQLPDMTLNVFSSFQDCDNVLRHPSSASDRLKSTAAQREIAEGAEPRPIGRRGFLFLDPPDHTRLRKLVSKASPRRLSRRWNPISRPWSIRCWTRLPMPGGSRSSTTWPIRCPSR